MSIFPATDLVVDVAHAADPQKLNAAVTRLSELSSTRAPSGVEFADLIDGVRDASKTGASVKTLSTGSGASHVGPLPGGVATRAARAGGAMENFEAFIIQSCLETILPKSEQGFFGQGSAGGIWRSMVAEQIANQIAKAGGVGLHKMLDGHWAQQGVAVDATAKRMSDAT